jgi:phage shock protein PspC (stress-responsive transcriptional regulator)
VRLAAVISVLFPRPPALAYVIGWIVIPGEDEQTG